MPPHTLLADDQLAARHILRFNLEQAGFAVLEATDGVEAWNILAREHVDLLVVDENMPRLTGTELCAKLRHVPALSDLPVIVITAAVPTPARELLEKLGVLHCFTKPFSPRELVEKIAAVLDAKTCASSSV